MMGIEFCRKCSVAKHPTTSEKNSVKQIRTVRLDSIQIQFQYHPICLPHANQNHGIERKSSEKVCLLAFVMKHMFKNAQFWTGFQVFVMSPKGTDTSPRSVSPVCQPD